MLEKFRANVLKVAEHSFQVPMPNSPLLLHYLCFGARFLRQSILAKECAVAMTTWLVKGVFYLIRTEI